MGGPPGAQQRPDLPEIAAGRKLIGPAFDGPTANSFKHDRGCNLNDRKACRSIRHIAYLYFDGKKEAAARPYCRPLDSALSQMVERELPEIVTP
jgi:hypothetical protein